MVDAEGTRPRQLHCAWNSNEFKDMIAAVKPREKNKLPSFPKSFFVAATEKESRIAISNQFGVRATPKNASGLSQKQFLIFDRCGDETRMIVSPFLSREQNRITLAKRSFDAYNVRDEKVEVEKKSFTNLIDQEKADENNIFDGESEMHEDTEEINALLYSDDSDDDSDDEDDEVTSTDHSPLKILKFADEVACSHGLNKRQKFHDGGYKNSSLVDAASSRQLIRFSDESDDVESSCGVNKNPSKDIGSGLCVEEKKVKIRETLKVLEQIVPGLKTKDPLFIIDGAIDYLKSLRLKAETFGVCLTTLQK